MANYNKIRHIVRIRQMLRAWRRKATSSAARNRSPPDVPAGHVAICVGSNRTRFIVRATHLNHPIFRLLLSRVEEEYGFSNKQGALEIPACDESLFEEILLYVSRGGEFQRCCLVGVPDYVIESRPLLHGFGSLSDELFQYEWSHCFR